MYPPRSKRGPEARKTPRRFMTGGVAARTFAPGTLARYRLRYPANRRAGTRTRNLPLSERSNRSPRYAALDLIGPLVVRARTLGDGRLPTGEMVRRSIRPLRYARQTLSGLGGEAVAATRFYLS